MMILEDSLMKIKIDNRRLKIFLYCLKDVQLPKELLKLLLNLGQPLQCWLLWRLGDNWLWSLLGPERQKVVAAGAALANQEIPKEGA
ncbi:hypothetical protein Tco_1293184 [Tanacetum coccineum]